MYSDNLQQTTNKKSSNNNANLAGLNRNISSHIGYTEGEHASLKVSIPISDIWEALTTPAKPSTEERGIAAGDQPMTLGDYIKEGIENIKSWFGENDKEPKTKAEIENKLTSLDQEILVNISKDSEKVPVINNATDRETLNKIRAEVESKHHGKADADKQKLINLSYNLLKKFQSDEYTPPPVQLASIGIITPGMLTPTVTSAVASAGTALLVLAEGAMAIAAANPITIGAVALGVGGYCLYNALLTKDKAQEYNYLQTKLANQDYLPAESISNYGINEDDDRIGIFDKKKHGNIDPKLKAKLTSTSAQSATGMPEPDDEEPEEKNETIENKEFKTKNFEKDDNIGLHRFTDRFEKTKFRDPKTGQYLEPDVGRNSGVRGHGGSYWKLYDKSGRKIGTITKDGRWLR